MGYDPYPQLNLDRGVVASNRCHSQSTGRAAAPETGQQPGKTLAVVPRPRAYTRCGPSPAAALRGVRNTHGTVPGAGPGGTPCPVAGTSRGAVTRHRRRTEVGHGDAGTGSAEV